MKSNNLSICSAWLNEFAILRNITVIICVVILMVPQVFAQSDKIPSKDYQYKSWLKKLLADAPQAQEKSMKTRGYITDSARTLDQNYHIELLASLDSASVPEDKTLRNIYFYFRQNVDDIYRATLFSQGIVNFEGFIPFAGYLEPGLSLPRSSLIILDAKLNRLPPYLTLKIPTEHLPPNVEPLLDFPEYWGSEHGSSLYGHLLKMNFDELLLPSGAQLDARLEALASTYQTVKAFHEGNQKYEIDGGSGTYVADHVKIVSEFSEAVGKRTERALGVRIRPSRCVVLGLSFVSDVTERDDREEERYELHGDLIGLIKARLDIGLHHEGWSLEGARQFVSDFAYVDLGYESEDDLIVDVAMWPSLSLAKVECPRQMTRLWRVYQAAVGDDFEGFYTLILKHMPRKMPALIQEIRGELATAQSPAP